MKRTPVDGAFPSFIAPLPPVNAVARRCPVPREKASNRILLVKLLAYGDCIMASPLVRALRDAYPEAYITWMVERKYLQAVDANPDIDEIIVWEGAYWQDLMPGRWKKWLDIPKRRLGTRWLAAAWKLRRQLRERRFDVLISMHPEKWRSLPAAAGAAVSIGVFETKPGREKFYQFAHRKASLPAHRTDQYLTPLASLGLSTAVSKQLVLGFTAEDAEAANDLLEQQGHPKDQSFVVLSAVTTSETRNWPADRYGQLGDALTHLGYRVALISSPNPQEREVVRRIAARMQTPPLLALGVLTFRQMAALIARASLIICGDTGPMHVAAAVGTPYLALFGSTPILGRAPQAARGLCLAHAVPCGPCDKDVCSQSGENILRCLKLISVEETLAAASKLLKSAA